MLCASESRLLQPQPIRAFGRSSPCRRPSQRPRNRSVAAVGGDAPHRDQPGPTDAAAPPGGSGQGGSSRPHPAAMKAMDDEMRFKVEELQRRLSVAESKLLVGGVGWGGVGCGGASRSHLRQPQNTWAGALAGSHSCPRLAHHQCHLGCHCGCSPATLCLPARPILLPLTCPLQSCASLTPHPCCPGCTGGEQERAAALAPPAAPHSEILLTPTPTAPTALGRRSRSVLLPWSPLRRPTQRCL